MDPVTLVASSPGPWRPRFAHHATVLAALLPAARIAHIGSTYLGFIRAKDVVEIMGGVPAGAGPATSLRLARAGYQLEGEAPGHAWHCWLSAARREAVVHVLALRGRQWEDRLLFRDHLMAHRHVARNYEALKARLAQSAPSWTDYTGQKAASVARVVGEAWCAAGPT